MNVKRIIACVLSFVMIVSVFVSANISNVSAYETLIYGFENTNDMRTGFSTTYSQETTITTQGSAAVKATFPNPVANYEAHGVSGYAMVQFPNALDLSAYDYFSIDVYFAQKMVGGNGLQVNFITGTDTEDGYNLMIGIDDNEAGWHTFLIAKNNAGMGHYNNATWSQINRVRFLWQNASKQVDSAVMIFDRLMGCDYNGLDAYTSGNKMILDNFDAATGLTPEFNVNLAVDSTTKTEGNGSVTMEPTIPTGQTGNIGGMALLKFKQHVNLSSYKKIYLDVYVSKAFGGSSGGLQVNFATKGQDGFNNMKVMNEWTAGWHTIEYTIDPTATGAEDARWSDINMVRITWFNYAQISGVTFKFDNFYATTDETTSSQSSQSSQSSESSQSSQSSQSSESSQSSQSSQSSSSGAPAVTQNATTMPVGGGADNDNIYLHTFDTLDGVEAASGYRTTVACSDSIKTQGYRSVCMTCNNTSFTDNVGGMFYINFEKVIDIAGMGSFFIDYYNDKEVTGAQQIQINFCNTSVNAGDGYNVVRGINNAGETLAVGWHTLAINAGQLREALAVAGTSLESINRIRVTWFNLAHLNNGVKFYFDNFYMTGGSGHDGTYTPYTEGTDLLLHDFESTNGLEYQFNSPIVRDSAVKTQGSYSVKATPNNPTGQTANIGAMVKIHLSGTVDLTQFDKITLDVYNNIAISGQGAIQINFGTLTEDGFNIAKGIDNFPAGWHTFEMSVASIQAAKQVSWADITKITCVRITWFNTSQMSGGITFNFDNLAGIDENAVAHYATQVDDNTIMLHDFEDTIGLKPSYGVELSTATDTDKVTEGSGSLYFNPTTPTGQTDNIGGRAMISFGTPVDFSTDGYKNIHFDLYIDQKVTGEDQLEVCFITNPSGGNILGFSKKLNLNAYEAGYNDIYLSRTSLLKTDVNGGDWKSIRAISLTWYNKSGSTNQKFYFDNFRVYINEPQDPTSSEESSDTSSSEPSSEVPTIIYGDVNDDKVVDAIDGTLILQYSVDLIDFTEEQIQKARVADLKNISAIDTLYVLWYSVDIIDVFPIELHQPEPSSGPESSSSSSSSGSSSESGNTSLVIPSTIVENKAYTTDTTADTSFKITSEGLAHKTIYFIQAAVKKGPTSSDRDWDTVRYITCLQGLINRDFGSDQQHTSVVYVAGDESDNFWLTYIRSAGIFKDFKTKTITSWDAFCTTFAAQMQQCGSVTWDPNVPATSNAAVTVCGVDGYLPVMYGSTLYSDLQSRGIAEKMSLYNRFTGSGTIWGTSVASSGSKKNDVYRWALAKYMDTNRCSSQYVAYTPDGIQTIPGNQFYASDRSESNCLKNLDYIVARRAFVFDLQPYAGDRPCDEPSTAAGVDNATMLQIFQKRYDRANGEFGQLLGFPPWWIKYTSETPNISNAGSKPAYWIEWMFCEYITMYNMAKEADAAEPSSMTNGSVYYKYRAGSTSFTNNRPSSIESYNRNIYYYTIYAGDYDSSAWLKEYTKRNFTDPVRGMDPIMWGFNPNLSWRVPMIFDYVYSKKTANDYFAAGEGAGYIIPSALFTGSNLAYAGRSRSNPSGADKWVAYAKPFYQLFDMDITGYIINGGNAINNNVMSTFNQLNPTGAIVDGATKRYKYNGVPYIGAYQGLELNDSTAANMYNYVFSTIGGKHCAAFRTVIWTPTDINLAVTQYAAYASAKGKTVKYVDPYTFFSLALTANEF